MIVSGQEEVREVGVPTAVRRGFLCRCPACGEGRLFGRFLKVEPACSDCGQLFHHHRADDFPPYLVMFIVGHLVGYGLFFVETRFDEIPLLVHALAWPTLAVVLCLSLLQPVKGAVIGLQFGLGMHGFDGRAGSGHEAGERRTWGDPEAVLRDGRPRQAVAEPEAS